MSKTSDKLAAGVRKVKNEPASATPQPTPASGQQAARDARAEAYGLPAPTHGLHPARIWPD